MKIRIQKRFLSGFVSGCLMLVFCNEAKSQLIFDVVHIAGGDVPSSFHINNSGDIAWQQSDGVYLWRIDVSPRMAELLPFLDPTGVCNGPGTLTCGAFLSAPFLGDSSITYVGSAYLGDCPAPIGGLYSTFDCTLTRDSGDFPKTNKQTGRAWPPGSEDWTPNPLYGPNGEWVKTNNGQTIFYVSRCDATFQQIYQAGDPGWRFEDTYQVSSDLSPLAMINQSNFLFSGSLSRTSGSGPLGFTGLWLGSGNSTTPTPIALGVISEPQELYCEQAQSLGFPRVAPLLAPIEGCACLYDANNSDWANPQLSAINSNIEIAYVAGVVRCASGNVEVSEGKKLFFKSADATSVIMEEFDQLPGLIGSRVLDFKAVQLNANRQLVVSVIADTGDGSVPFAALIYLKIDSSLNVTSRTIAAEGHVVEAVEVGLLYQGASSPAFTLSRDGDVAIWASIECGVLGVSSEVGFWNWNPATGWSKYIQNGDSIQIDGVFRTISLPFQPGEEQELWKSGPYGSRRSASSERDDAIVVRAQYGPDGIWVLLRVLPSDITIAGPTACCAWASGGCIADFDGSGGTPDSADLDAFFVAWLLGDPCTDADDSDGTPDASDLEVFFNYWLAGNCD
jgi:hypothetical protein